MIVLGFNIILYVYANGNSCCYGCGHLFLLGLLRFVFVFFSVLASILDHCLVKCAVYLKHGNTNYCRLNSKRNVILCNENLFADRRALASV